MPGVCSSICTIGDSGAETSTTASSLPRAAPITASGRRGRALIRRAPSGWRPAVSPSCPACRCRARRRSPALPRSRRPVEGLACRAIEDPDRLVEEAAERDERLRLLLLARADGLGSRRPARKRGRPSPSRRAGGAGSRASRARGAAPPRCDSAASSGPCSACRIVVRRAPAPSPSTTGCGGAGSSSQ